MDDSLHLLHSDAQMISTDDDSIWIFPSWSHMLLPPLAVGIHKGGVDFDDSNARGGADNRALAEMTIKQFENWDNELQMTEVEAGDRNDFRPTP